jgi:hypothetical protein
MRVDDMKFPKTLQEPYAAVFICDDPDGNLILRGLEPPEHDKWDAALDPANGKVVLEEIREWIRGNLMTLAEEESGDPEEIPELEKFLPYDEDTEKMSESKMRTHPSGDTGLDESAIEVGAERDEVEDEIEEFVRKPSSVKDVGGDGPNIRKRGGQEKDGGNGAGTGEDDGLDDGIVRIDTSAAHFRIFHTGKSGENGMEYCLIIKPLIDQEGSVGIVARGDDTTVYPISLSYAKDWKGAREYKHKGSYIEDLKLKKGQTLKIELATKSSSRYALGIENHES